MAKSRSWLQKPLTMSAAMDRLFHEQMTLPVAQHPDTDFDENMQLGFPYQVIREEVIKKGLADFTDGYSHPVYGDLTSDQVALLYCFSNMKGHFFSSYANLRLNKNHVTKLLDNSKRFLVVDIGCGPATSAFSINELLPKRKMLYYGVDISGAMRKKAKSLWESAQGSHINRKSIITRKKNWTSLRPKNIKHPCCVLLNFSYFFASHFLDDDDVESLAKLVESFIANKHVKMLSISYTNSPEEIANEKYLEFKEAIGIQDSAKRPLVTTVEYYKRRNSHRIGSQTFVREMLKLKK